MPLQSLDDEQCVKRISTSCGLIPESWNVSIASGIPAPLSSLAHEVKSPGPLVPIRPEPSGSFTYQDGVTVQSSTRSFLVLLVNRQGFSSSRTKMVAVADSPMVNAGNRCSRSPGDRSLNSPGYRA